MSPRARLRWYGLALDLAVLIASSEVAIVVFRRVHHFSLFASARVWDSGLIVGAAAVALTFLWLGLYKMEAYVSRPLHVLTIAKGSVIALVVTAFAAFSLRSPIIVDSRLTIFTAFGVFFIVDCIVRLTLLDRLYLSDIRRRSGGSMVIGSGSESSHIAGRCRDLRGFVPVAALEPSDTRRNGYDAEPALLRAIGETRPAPRQVFLDSASLGHKAVFDLIGAARARGAEVYVVGRIVSPLDATRILLRLFEMPVMHVDGGSGALARLPGWKRAFDVAVAAVGLILLSPVFALIAVLIKRDSPGPVFYRQTRIGFHGRPFDFLKFRSMEAGNDPSEHRTYVCRLIDGGPPEADEAALVSTDAFGRPVYKLAGDARVTRVGRFLRKYSLDELPQLWNVLRGDMSIVGPRPALEYEVSAYKQWHRRRLDVMPGVSGLWQVAGRSRVGFDEMVFQDVIYSYNQNLLTDVSLCLRTLPAVLIGRGAA